MHNKIKKFIQEHQMIQEGDTLILGVSGGADSMLLLHYFLTYQAFYHVTLKVAHVHHGLRDEADLDAKLVEAFCKQNMIPFFRHDCQVKVLASQKKISEEEAGREERYQFFNQLVGPNSKIVTAHHMNDQAETILMHFIRGSGMKGLGGISPKRDTIIRPFLCLTRSEIEGYCKQFNIHYREDKSNFELKYTRNKIRLQLLPFIEKLFNPSITHTLMRTSTLYREADDFIKSQTVFNYEKCCLKETQTSIELKSSTLITYHIYMQKCILLQAIQKLIGLKDYTITHVESCIALINGQVGKILHLPDGLVVLKEYDKIILTKEAFNKDTVLEQPYSIPIEQNQIELKALGIRIEITLDPLYLPIENNYTKRIDCAKIKKGLCVRTRMLSDYMNIQGVHKKLSRIMIDDKIPKAKRDTLLLLADGHEIIWIIGYRFSTRYYITKETKKILEIKTNKLENLT